MLAGKIRSIASTIALACVAPAASPSRAQAPAAPADATERQAAGEWTAQQDHRDMMDRLGIKALRPGAEGMNRQAPNYQNTDESKANPWPDLPDPLRLNDGRKVTTAEMWWRQRRPEIVEDFDREVYGRVPKDVPKVTWEVVRSTEGAESDTPVISKTIVGHADNSKCPSITVDIQLSLVTPAHATGPVPVMMEFGFNFGGFRGTGAGGPGGPGRKGPDPQARPGGRGWQEQVLAKGWGYAIITP